MRILHRSPQGFLRRTLQAVNRHQGFFIAMRSLVYYSLLFLGFGLLDCRSVRDIPSPSRGSADSPICSDGAPAQRLYLHKLRDSTGRRLRYEREDPVPGQNGHLLDPFILSPEGEGWLEEFLFWLTPNKDAMGRRIYMDMYMPGCEEKEAPPGFTLSRPE